MDTMKKLSESIGNLKVAFVTFLNDLELHLQSQIIIPDPEPVPPVKPEPEPIPPTQPEPLPNIKVLYSRPDFNHVNTGLLTNTEFKKIFDVGQWRNLRSYNPASNGPTVFNINGQKVLGHYFAKGQFGSQTGMNQWMTIPEGHKEMWWGCEFMFQDGFEYSISGKFFGFACGRLGRDRVASGGDGPASNLIANNMGGLVRISPRETSEGIKFNWYIYDYRMTGKYGRSGSSHFGQVKSGQWQKMVVRTAINPEAKTGNGIAQCWLDGKLVATIDNLWLNHPQTSEKTFGEVGIQTFMGGADSQFASKKDQYIYQKNFFVWIPEKEELTKIYTSNDKIPLPQGL